MASIQIRGLEELSRKLRNLDDFQDIVEPPLIRAGQRIQRFMADYPPQRPGSRYIRGFGMAGGRRTSERLGQRWTTSRPRRNFQGVEVKVGNNASYAPFVQSRRFQARIHRNRWQTDEDAVRRLEPEIQRDFERVIQREIRR